MLTLSNIVYQMNDGIHKAHDFLMVDESVHYISPTDKKLDMMKQLLPIPRNSFIDAIDLIAGDDWDLMESLYGKYNSFAMEPGTNRYYAWYDNDR
jgi:hypothetical protein